MNALRNVLAVILSVSALAFAGCAKKTAETASPAIVSGLAVAQVGSRQIPATVDSVGTVHAKESAVLSAQVMGRVAAVEVREGDQVRAGEMLLSIDDAQERSGMESAGAAVSSSDHQVQMAETEASLASSTLARYQILRDRKSVSPQEYDEVDRRAQIAAAQLATARSQAQAARAAAEAARTTAGYTRIHAPFAGVVAARHVDPGAMAVPGAPLLEIERAGALQLYTNVDESLLPALQKGTIVPVSIPAVSTQPLRGRVAEVVPSADPSSHSFPIKIDLPQTAKLRSGMFGTAKVVTGDRTVLLVSLAAVVTHGSMSGVWVLDRNRIASLRYITLGAVHDGNAEVLSGLSGGETVVLLPGDRELGGARVEERP